MADGTVGFTFEPFRLDPEAHCLWHGVEAVGLRPKTWEVLLYLVERAGQMVTKDELITRVWAGTVVSEGTLTQSIRELRAVLGDDSKHPRFIATVHRRGYRFIAPLARAEMAGTAPAPTAHRLVGRDHELARLQVALDETLRGQRRSVFVTGDAGIGKTSLLDEFMRSVHERYAGKVLLARGQCVEQRREAEPYLPVLEALHELSRSREGTRVVEVLRRFAPTWLLQMPWLLASADLEMLQRQLVGAGSERMLRELTVAMSELAAQVPLVLVLEDLHWSDLATVDLLAALARRRDPAPLLIVGSLRPTVAAGEHPLADLLRTLTARGDAAEIPLQVLSPEAVRTYVMQRLDDRAPAPLVEAIQRHSGGSPLFLVTALGYALAQKWLVQHAGEWQLEIAPADLDRAIPDGLRQLIEVQVGGLDASDRSLLEAASVAGVEFSARSLAVALGQPAEETEAGLDRLSRRFRFIRRIPKVDSSGVLLSARFEFSHALYHQVLYEGTLAATRRHLHLEVAHGLEVEHGERASEAAAELAVHYERGGDFEKAAKYLGLAALHAHSLAADRESMALLENAITLLGQVDDSPRRRRREADLCIQLGAVRGSIYGRGSERYITPFSRALELAQQLDDVPRMFLARMAGFGHFSLTQQLRQAEAVCDDLLVLAARVGLPDLVAVANGAMGSVRFAMGRLESARRHLETALATLNPHDPSTQLYRRLEDPEILCLTGQAWVLAQLGYPEQARRVCDTAIGLGAERAMYHHTYCLNAAAILEFFLDDAARCQDYAEQSLALAGEHGFDGFVGNTTLLAAWARERQTPRVGAWRRLQAEVETYRHCTQRFGMVPYLAAVAEACLAEGASEAGLGLVTAADAMMQATGELGPEANVLRIKAQLLAAAGHDAREVESCFAAALQVAQAGDGKLIELRTATDFALWGAANRRSEPARERLRATYEWFTEGFDTPDLQRARAVLKGC